MTGPREPVDGILIDGNKPIPKVTAAAAAGAATVVLAWVLAEFGIVLPAPVTAAVTVLLTAGTAYLKR